MTRVGQHVGELVLGDMRVSSTDVDASTVNRKAEVALEQITSYLDLPVPWVDDPEKWPASVLEGAVTVTRELCERKNAPFGIAGAWEDGTAARISSDPLAGVRTMLAPFKQRWGIA